MNYKNITLIMKIKGFGIRTDIDEREAIIEALTKDLENCKGVENYLSDPTISIYAEEKDEI